MATPSYAPNYFAAGSAPKEAAYAGGLRSYAQNPFAGTQQVAPVLAPHLSQPNPLGEDLTGAYKEALGTPAGVDIDRLWRSAPTSPVFKPGYQHDVRIRMLADALRQKRELGAPAAYAPEANIYNG